MPRPMVGDMVTLKRPMLANPSGTLGYVFDTYPAFGDPSGVGVQVILANGSYDGFSPEEQELFLTPAGHSRKHEGYLFQGVLYVSQSFRGGYWDFE